MCVAEAGRGRKRCIVVRKFIYFRGPVFNSRLGEELNQISQFFQSGAGILDRAFS
jgi:hypothetical protein